MVFEIIIVKLFNNLNTNMTEVGRAWGLFVCVVLICNMTTIDCKKQRVPLLEEYTGEGIPHVADADTESGSGEVDRDQIFHVTVMDDIIDQESVSKDLPKERQIEEKGNIPLVLIVLPISAGVVVISTIVITIVLMRKRNKKKESMRAEEACIMTVTNTYCEIAHGFQDDKSTTSHGYDVLKRE
uniref:Uncharacterized protein n=1 Tax=Pinctada fucata TaxID=50426 RepID=A0A194ANK4_PINFU